MSARLELVVGVLRVGRSLHKHGDPYEFACTVIVRGDTAELIGGGGQFDIRQWAKVKLELRRHGIRKITWDRRNHDPRKVSGRM